MIYVLDGTRDPNFIKLARLKLETGWDFIHDEQTNIFILVDKSRRKLMLHNH